MKGFTSLLALAGIMTAALPVKTHAATTDPLQFVYVFPGVLDNGGSTNVGTATVVHCTNLGPNTERFQFVVWAFDGAVEGNKTFDAKTFHTVTAETHGVNMYSADVFLNTGTVVQGAFGVLSTSVYVVCTGQVVNAASSAPNGIDLHGIRFNSLPGTTE